MALFGVAAPGLLLLLQLLLGAYPSACYPTAAPAVQAQQHELKDPSHDGFDDEADHEVVDIQSVLAALGLLSGTFLAVLVGLRVYLHCMRRRPARQSHRKKMTEEEIEKRFPVTKTEGGETCVVCLSNIEAGEDCRVTQCGHTFHADCLLAWWLHKPRRVLRCPICRTRQRKQRKGPQQEQAANEGEGAESSAAESPPADGEAAVAAGDGVGELRPLELPSPAKVDEKREGGKRDADESSFEEPSDGIDKEAEPVVGIVVLASPRASGIKLEKVRGDLHVEDVEMNSDIAGNNTKEVAVMSVSV